MKSSMLSRMVAAAVPVLVLASGYVFLPQAYAQDSSKCWTFIETNKQVCGALLDYWRAHGGISRFGFPISEQAERVGGQPIQYFERAVFEVPRSGDDVNPLMLAPLGADRFRRKYPENSSNSLLPVAPYTEMPGDILSFPQPSYPLSGAFLHFWQEHGAEDEFGFPISPLLREESELDDKEYIMQYFETAVFEYHPENLAPYDVLLSQLGTFLYKTLFPEPQDILHGLWCGPQMSIYESVIAFHGGVRGYFTDPVVLVFGNFYTLGTHEEPLGKYGRDWPGREQQVHYFGKVVGDIITLSINYDWDPSRHEGPYTATLGTCP